MTRTSNILPLRRAPSMSTVTPALFHDANTAMVAAKNEMRPPSAFDERLARRAIAPLMPAPPKFAKYGSACEPAELTWLLREEGVAREPGRGGPPRDLRPPSSRRAVRRRRVDEEDRAAQCLSAVTVSSATRVMRSTAARNSSSV